jgi:hypothetical protein
LLSKKGMSYVTYSVRERVISLKILSYQQLITFSKLNFMHSVAYKYWPSSFSNVWISNNEMNKTINFFYIMFIHTKKGKKYDADTSLQERRQEKNMVNWW